MKFLTAKSPFPDVSEASEEGLLAVGGDLSTDRLLLAYKSGIFPWFENDQTILWWSPNPRFVLFPSKLKISKSMKQVLRNKTLSVTINKNFKEVITACSQMDRKNQESTWITAEMINAYTKLHELGYATSVEVWRDKNLIGGFYGVTVNKDVFCGESMFSKESNASKMAFITFVKNHNYQLIDCQVYTKHLESLGAENISRELFLKYLQLPK